MCSQFDYHVCAIYCIVNFSISLCTGTSTQHHQHKTRNTDGGGGPTLLLLLLLQGRRQVSAQHVLVEAQLFHARRIQQDGIVAQALGPRLLNGAWWERRAMNT